MNPDRIQKEIILQLIKADLQHSKLIHGLEQAGFSTDYFHIDLAKSVLRLTGFQESEINDDLYSFYYTHIENLLEEPLPEFIPQLSSLTLKMLNILQLEKIARKKDIQ